LTFNGFQDRRNRPLCHLSGRKIRVWGIMAKYNCRFLYDSLSVNLLPGIETVFLAPGTADLIYLKNASMELKVILSRLSDMIQTTEDVKKRKNT
jgi:hypothetical protein